MPVMCRKCQSSPATRGMNIWSDIFMTEEQPNLNRGILSQGLLKQGNSGPRDFEPRVVLPREFGPYIFVCSRARELSDNIQSSPVHVRKYRGLGRWRRKPLHDNAPKSLNSYQPRITSSIASLAPPLPPPSPYVPCISKFVVRVAEATAIVMKVVSLIMIREPCAGNR
jgi:hypothetical protein